VGFFRVDWIRVANRIVVR